MRCQILRHLAIHTGPGNASEVSRTVPRVGLGRNEVRPTPHSWHGWRGVGRAGGTAGSGVSGRAWTNRANHHAS
jgi:hypothetical protein